MESLIRRLEAIKGHQRRYLIALSGGPGSGKSTLAKKLEETVEGLVCLSMDGFHYSRAELDKFDNPSEAHFMRGAPFTFHEEALRRALLSLKTTSDESVAVPGFDHAQKDPSDSMGRIVHPDVKLILVEGNYLALQDWFDKVGCLFDEHWQITCPESLARDRVSRRHVEAGICATLAEGVHRFNTVDLLNFRLVYQNSQVAFSCVIDNSAEAIIVNGLRL